MELQGWSLAKSIKFLVFAMIDDGHSWNLVETYPKKLGWLCEHCGSVVWTEPHETPNPHIKIKGIIPENGGSVIMFTCKESVVYNLMKQ